MKMIQVNGTDCEVLLVMVETASHENCGFCRTSLPMTIVGIAYLGLPDSLCTHILTDRQWSAKFPDGETVVGKEAIIETANKWMNGHMYLPEEHPIAKSSLAFYKKLGANLNLYTREIPDVKSENITYELCPLCENEVKIPAVLGVHTCPECLNPIVCCSMCEVHSCETCVFEKDAKKQRDSIPVVLTVLDEKSAPIKEIVPGSPKSIAHQMRLLTSGLYHVAVFQDFSLFQSIAKTCGIPFLVNNANFDDIQSRIWNMPNRYGYEVLKDGKIVFKLDCDGAQSIMDYLTGTEILSEPGVYTINSYSSRGMLGDSVTIYTDDTIWQWANKISYEELSSILEQLAREYQEVAATKE